MDLRASIETIEDNNEHQQRPVYAAPSLMSIRSCFVVPSNGFHAYYAQSQPQLSHGYSQPNFISRMSNSADHLVTSSLNQLDESALSAAAMQNESNLSFHEQVKNSAAMHRLKSSATTVCSDSDVNVIGTAVRIQVSACAFFVLSQLVCSGEQELLYSRA